LIPRSAMAPSDEDKRGLIAYLERLDSAGRRQILLLFSCRTNRTISGLLARRGRRARGRTRFSRNWTFRSIYDGCHAPAVERLRCQSGISKARCGDAANGSKVAVGVRARDTIEGGAVDRPPGEGNGCVGTVDDDECVRRAVQRRSRDGWPISCGQRVKHCLDNFDLSA
jgi:hypothetical protein